MPFNSNPSLNKMQIVYFLGASVRLSNIQSNTQST